MLYLLITPIILLILSFIIVNRDIKVVSRLFSLVLVLDVLLLPIFNTDMYYIKYATFDCLMLIFSCILKSKVNRYIVASVCIISFCMNIYEHLSYYQTVFYNYRHNIQFALIQIMIFGLIYKCQWREFWKTNTQR